MKILHINSYYIGNKIHSEIIKRFDSRGIENRVIVPIKIGTSGKNRIDLKYGEIKYIECFNDLDRFNFFSKAKKTLKNLEIEDIDKYHISWGHSLFTNGYISYKLKKKYGLKYTVSVRNTDINIFFKYAFHLKYIGVKILREAEQIICISHANKKSLLKKIPVNVLNEISEKIVVIPNGIDDTYWNNFEKLKDNNQNHLNITFVGSLDKNKNPEILFKLREKMSNEININLRIIGDGPLYSKLLKKYGLKECLLGKIDEKMELIEIYNKTDIFLMNSKHETFGVVYVEALSQGVPIIYTKDQGIDGFFEEGEIGYAVRYNDIDGIIDRVKKIMKNNLIINKSKIHKKFNWDMIIDEYLKSTMFGARDEK